MHKHYWLQTQINALLMIVISNCLDRGAWSLGHGILAMQYLETGWVHAICRHSNNFHSKEVVEESNIWGISLQYKVSVTAHNSLLSAWREAQIPRVITVKNLPLMNYQQCYQIGISCTDHPTKACTVSITINFKANILKHEQNKQQ